MFLFQDVEVLYKTLKSNTFVIGLDLGYNNIGDIGAAVLGDLLQVSFRFASFYYLNFFDHWDLCSGPQVS